MLVIVATVGVIAFNYLAATGYLGGVMPSFISDKYPTRVTPAGFAFAIWSLIYCGLLAFSIYQALPSKIERFRRWRSVYILNCAANCAWLYCWHHEMIVICVAVILVMLGTLAVINSDLKKTDSLAEFWFVKFPFGLYFGWVTAATILNSTIAMIYLNVQMFDSIAVIVGAGLLLTAVALGVIIRFKLRQSVLSAGNRVGVDRHRRQTERRNFNRRRVRCRRDFIIDRRADLSRQYESNDQ